ncbi:MAG: FtsQ-type POTRA domain-containing protein [Gammaproteobacteria bacterium]|nr:FtsQ-type POTRA domain-containing protein [Gammaproteobacteria bacterium]
MAANGRGASSERSRRGGRRPVEKSPAVRKQGASRRGQKVTVDWRAGLQALGRWCKRGAVLSVLLGGLYFGYSGAVGWLDKPVASVKINGEFTHVSRELVAERVYGAMGSSFMKLKLEDIQAALHREPWIDRARVERRWPDGLEVTVVEHKPIARWGDSDALNHRGEIIRLQVGQGNASLLQGLPRLSGADGLEQEVMAQYRAISNLLKQQKMVVQQLTCDASRSWSLALQDGVVIEIGRDQVINRVQRLLTVYESHLHERWSQLQRIDLRYFNGLAVQWKDEVSA